MRYPGLARRNIRRPEVPAVMMMHALARRPVAPFAGLLTLKRDFKLVRAQRTSSLQTAIADLSRFRTGVHKFPISIYFVLALTRTGPKQRDLEKGATQNIVWCTFGRALLNRQSAQRNGTTFSRTAFRNHGIQRQKENR